jgi:hypothetical protein
MPAPVPQSQRKGRAPCLDLSATAERLIEAQKRLMYQNTGDFLYNGVSYLLAECKGDLKAYGFWHPSITAGKVTGVLMDAYANHLDELNAAMYDREKITQMLADACECIYLAACEKEHARFVAGAEPTAEMLTMSRHHELACC